MSPDPFGLARFLTAQEGEYEDALAELRAGRKRGHWMWFIFPQVKGLGQSYNAQYFGIASIAEACAYLEHPVLGARLIECTAAVNAVENRSAEAILGGIDAVKFRSSLTLFLAAAPNQEVFQAALNEYFNGQPDRLTLELLGLTRD